jgi:hypothetical protein
MKSKSTWPPLRKQKDLLTLLVLMAIIALFHLISSR